MHLERALRVINLLDIPKHKRKFWPQHCAIVVRDSSREIVDVIQFFSSSSPDWEHYARLYPGCTTFFNSAGDLQTVAELQARIDWCFQPITDSTYIVGRGLVGKRKSRIRTKRWPRRVSASDDFHIQPAATLALASGR